MFNHELPQRATTSDTCSTFLPEYRSMAGGTVPPSYASGSDTASIMGPSERVDRWRIQVPVGSPQQETLSILDTSSNGDSSHDSASPIARRDRKLLMI